MSYPPPAGIINRHKKTFLALSVSLDLFPSILHAQTDISRQITGNQIGVNNDTLSFNKGNGSDNDPGIKIEWTDTKNLTILNSEKGSNASPESIIDIKNGIETYISINGTLTLGSDELKTYQYSRVQGNLTVTANKIVSKSVFYTEEDGAKASFLGEDITFHYSNEQNEKWDKDGEYSYPSQQTALYARNKSTITATATNNLTSRIAVI